MSSDKAPEKLYYSSGVGSGTHKEPFIDDYGVMPITYIREDLTLDAKLKEPGAAIQYKTEEEKELASLMNEINKTETLRRREMFEKVAVVCIAQYSGFSWKEIARIAEELLEKSDKFARGEE